MINAATKRELKAAVITALVGRLPIRHGNYELKDATTHAEGDRFLLVRVRDLQGNLLMDLEVNVKEVF